MKLLLHTCCAPCAIYPVSEAKKDNFSVTGFFCNSNIHPQSEYIKRKEAAREYFKSEGLELVFVAGNKTPPGQCPVCWEMRLKETVSFAEKNSFGAFTTTLLGSPYQDHRVIKGICEGLSGASGVKFYYKDFRLGFRDAHERARDGGMYRQKYCGCAVSLAEREEIASSRLRRSSQ